MTAIIVCNFEIPAVKRGYRLVSYGHSFRVTRSVASGETLRLHHHKVPTLDLALSTLLMVLVADGQEAIAPLQAGCSARETPWQHGRSGFPALSAVIRQHADEQARLLAHAAKEYALALEDIVTEATLRGIDVPLWRPVPAWLDAAVKDVRTTRREGGRRRFQDAAACASCVTAG